MKHKKKDLEASYRQWEQALTDVVVRSGAITTDRVYGMPYELDTLAGILHLQVRRNSAFPGASVYTFFEQPERATALLGSAPNPYSGKWNHHYFPKGLGQAELDMDVQHFERQLMTVLPRKTT